MGMPGSSFANEIVGNVLFIYVPLATQTTPPPRSWLPRNEYQDSLCEQLWKKTPVHDIPSSLNEDSLSHLPPHWQRCRRDLLQLDSRSLLLELGLDRLGLFLRHVLLNVGRSAVDHILGLLQPE